MNSEDVTAVITANEPADGTKLILDMGSNDWRLIVRDDEAARSWDSLADEHWFDGSDTDTDPMALHQHLQDAVAVYALGEKLAEFGR